MASGQQRSCCNCALIRYRWWVGVNVTFNLEEYRKYLYQLVQARFLGIDGTLRRKSQPQAHILAPASVESTSVVADD